MIDFREEDQNIILHAMEDDLLALVAIDITSDEFVVLYTDGGYRHFEHRFKGKDFFSAWERVGLTQIAETDRERMRTELSKANLLRETSTSRTFITTCSFFVDGEPAICRIKVKRGVLTDNTLVISIRNIDATARREQDIRALQESLDQMRLRNTGSQMHPHFLYNALSSIREIVLVDPEYGADLLYDFTTHLRASIRALGSDRLIPFSRALEHIKSYVNIEKIRFGDRFNVIYDIEATDFHIIPLAIQPIVENAFKHGLYEKDSDDGEILIRTRETSDYWEIIVQDNGVGFDFEATAKQIQDGHKDSTGLLNVKYRLETIMKASVDIQSKAGQGTKVAVRIPKAANP